MPDSRPIGVFDSGLGGLTVLREIRALLADEPFLYVADQAHAPYGERSLEEILRFLRAIVRFFLSQEVKLIVLACNTASAAALHPLRQEFSLPFVGMEPAVKPAAETTKTGRVGVLATAATFQGKPFASVVERFANGVEVYTCPCPGLVEWIETHEGESPELMRMLSSWIEPLREKGIDKLVLACTHYPLVRQTIEKIAGPSIEVIDPAPAVARQVSRVLDREGLRVPPSASSSSLSCSRFFTTGPNRDAFARRIRTILGIAVETIPLVWRGEEEILLADNAL